MAGNGLGVPPTAMPGILLPALWAHGELLHRSIFPIIGQLFQDTVTRPTGSTTDKGIGIAPVLWVFHLLQAVFTQRQIRRKDRNFRGQTGAWDNLEVFQPFRPYWPGLYVQYKSARWRV